MRYDEWAKEHHRKRQKIIDKLSHLTEDEVIDYFSFHHMVKHEPDFCPLYPLGKKCHDMADLNCYLCACPNFEFNDEGLGKIGEKRLYSRCMINSPDGSLFETADACHQNCERCTIPHTKEYAQKYTLSHPLKPSSSVSDEG